MKSSTAALVTYLAVVALAVGAAASPRVRPRTLQRLPHSLKLAGVRDTLGLSAADCGGQTQTCTSCTTRLECVRLNNALQPLRTTECPLDTPYCSAGACVATLPDESCVRPPQPSGAFACNGDGYFPDPATCRGYWMCAGGSAYRFDCTDFTGTVYSHAKAMCVPSSEAPCVSTLCTNALVGVYQRYSPAPEVFFVCRDAVPANALVAACPKSHAVDAATGDCVLACVEEGRMPDQGNATRYYECVQTGANSFSQPLPRICPAGSSFSAEQQRCLTGHEGDASGSGEGDDKGYYEDYYAPDPSIPESYYDLPSTLMLGAASAAYQIEGAWNVSDKTDSIWDVFYHSRPTMDNGDVADDSFHKYTDDIAMLQELKLQFYRFSISWPRLLPGGDSSNPSPSGTQYYNDVINALLASGIEPVITLYHWDLPQKFQNDGGWLNSAMQDRYVDYASYCFQTFGDRVKKWILINEPLTQCVLGYEYAEHAPGVAETGTGAYLCSHNMVLAHAKAYRAYQANFKSQGGIIGSAINMAFNEPMTSSQADRDAAERLNQWQFGWFADPLFFGDYPAEMRRRVDALSAAEGRTESRLPRFTAEEKVILKGAMDFLGLNNYNAARARALSSDQIAALTPGYRSDSQTEAIRDPQWTDSAVDGFPVTPWSVAGCVLWIKDRYNNAPVFITENGYAGAKDERTEDQKRTGFYSGYMRGLMRAINKDKCNVMAYTAWSLADNLEWNDGYSVKFGLVYVDFNDPNRPRKVKNSGAFFQSVVTNRHVPYIPVS